MLMDMKASLEIYHKCTIGTLFVLGFAMPNDNWLSEGLPVAVILNYIIFPRIHKLILVKHFSKFWEH